MAVDRIDINTHGHQKSNAHPGFVVVVVVVVLKRLKRGKCLCQQSPVLIGRGALDGEELFTIEGSKNWRSTPGQPEEREK